MEVGMRKIGQGQGPEIEIGIHANDVFAGQGRVPGIHNRNVEEGQGTAVLGMCSCGEEELVNAPFAENSHLSGERLELEKAPDSSDCVVWQNAAKVLGRVRALEGQEMMLDSYRVLEELGTMLVADSCSVAKDPAMKDREMLVHGIEVMLGQPLCAGFLERVMEFEVLFRSSALLPFLKLPYLVQHML